MQLDIVVTATMRDYNWIMGSPLKAIPPEFESLSMEERIRYVQDLWDYIASDPQSIPVPEEHKRILDERLKTYRENPDAGRPWGAVREELLSKCGSVETTHHTTSSNAGSGRDSKVV